MNSQALAALLAAAGLGVLLVVRLLAAGRAGAVAWVAGTVWLAEAPAALLGAPGRRADHGASAAGRAGGRRRRRVPGGGGSGRPPPAVGVCDRVRPGRAGADPDPLRLAGREAARAALRRARGGRPVHPLRHRPRERAAVTAMGSGAAARSVRRLLGGIAGVDGRPAPGRRDDALLLSPVRLHGDADRPARLEPAGPAGGVRRPVRPRDRVRRGGAVAGGDAAHLLESERRGPRTRTGRSSA